MRRRLLAIVAFGLFVGCGDDPEPVDAGANDAAINDTGFDDRGIALDGSPIDGSDGGADDASDGGTNDGAPQDGSTDGGPPPTVVINEIFYHPEEVAGDAEFLELFNNTNAPVALGGWRVQGIGFTFPAGATVAANDYAVIAGDATAFTAAFGGAPDFTTTGNLSNSGEAIILLDGQNVVVDQVTYSDQLPWPVIADGDGPSLELISPELDNALARSWAAGGPTPGVENDSYRALPPPYVVNVTFTSGPSPDAIIPIAAEIDDATEADLVSRIDFGPTSSVAMTPGPSGTFLGEIPGQTAGSLVRFRIVARGPTGEATWPRAGDSVTWDGTVVTDPSVTTMLPLFQWFMDPADYFQAINHRETDQLEPAVFYFDGVLYSDIQVRVKGNSSRNFEKNNWKFKLPRGHEIVRPGLVPQPLDQFNLQSSYADKSYVRDLLAYRTLAAAGMPSNLAFHVRLHQNAEFYGLYTFVQDMDGEYLRDNGLPSDGAWYEADGGDGRPMTMGDIEFNYEKATRDNEPWDDLVDFTFGFDQSGQPLRDYVFDNLVLSTFINYLAVNVILHNNDQIAKNFYLHRDTFGTQRWSIQAWDMDLTMGRNFGPGDVLNDLIWADDDMPDPARPQISPSHPRYGDQDHQKWDDQWNRITNAFHFDDVLRAMFYRRLRTLMDQMLAGDYFEQMIAIEDAIIGPEAILDRARWFQWGDQMDLAEATSQIVDDYLPRRRVHLFTTHRTPSEIPPIQSSTPAVVINELHYRPDNGAELEFVELYNASVVESVDLSGWSVTGLGLTIPAGTVILPGRYLVLVKNDVLFRGARGGGRFLTPYTDVLDDAGEAVALVDRAGVTVDRVVFSAVAPWPTTPAGTGPSLELIDVASDHLAPASWAPSLAPGGTPGARNTVTP